MKDLYILGAKPLPGQNSIFVCPSVRKQPVPAPSLSKGYFMYSFNNRMDPNGTPRFKRNEVIYPSDTVTFTENEDEFPSTSGVYTTARHNKRANLGFVDGHAAPVHTNDFRRAMTEDNGTSEFSTGRKVYWFPYPGAPN
jgi:prepilin-type processing-associated H-X9-DG protein